MQATINLPKSFAEHCLVNKRHSQAKTYVYLKMNCSGELRLNNDVVNLACKRLSISRGTFYRHLTDLKRWDWIGYSKQSKIYFIRSFSYTFLCKYYKFYRYLSIDILIHSLKIGKEF